MRAGGDKGNFFSPGENFQLNRGINFNYINNEMNVQFYRDDCSSPIYYSITCTLANNNS